jgi:CHASE2 domain-containing sensor protein/signal transduction histidine kinase
MPFSSKPDPDGLYTRSDGGRGWVQRRGAWLLLTGGLLSLVTVLTLIQPMPRVDRLLQDIARAALAPPPSADIVVVAIDEKTVAAVGRWPWRRALHAELLRRIAVQSPRCIGLDLLLTETDPNHPEDDDVLVDAMLDSGCVVLPMALRSDDLPGGKGLQKELLPIPVLAAAATGLGHAHLSVDLDGIARSVYLREGFQGREWPHFAMMLRDAADAYAGRRPPLSQPSRPDIGTQADGPRPWLRSQHEMIVFTRGSVRFTTFSYIDVLRGEVPADAFRGRYVLVGATASGLGDAHATSVPQDAGLMPGVYIFANVLQAVLGHHGVSAAGPWQDLLFNLGPLAIALVGLLWLRPLGVIALVGVMLALQLGIHLARPAIGVEFAPAAGFAGLLLVYPLWSLMRLSAAIRYLRRGTEELWNDVGGRAAPHAQRQVGDFLDRQMAATWAAAHRMRDVHRFVRDGLDQLPDATVTLNTVGSVVLANLAALSYWQRSTAEMLGQDAHQLMAGIRRCTTGAPMLPNGALLGAPEPIVGEGEDSQGRTLLLRCVPFFDAGNEHAGWMVSLVDVTVTRRAQSQRDEALRFISHDAREPSAAILTILELARTRPDAFADGTLLDRIERHAQTGLELADGFVNLARAEAEPFRAEVLDLVALLRQTVDNAWAHARKRHVRVLLVSGAIEEALCIADRSLLTRALGNVLSNALKYSPPGFDLRCGVTGAGRYWRVAVQDQGPGIAPELQSQLFQPFHRLHHEGHPEVHGVGLGLLLVRTVVQRHGGTIEIDSAADAGCTVTLVMPKPTAVELEALVGNKE